MVRQRAVRERLVRQRLVRQRLVRQLAVRQRAVRQRALVVDAVGGTVVRERCLRLRWGDGSGKASVGVELRDVRG